MWLFKNDIPRWIATTKSVDSSLEGCKNTEFVKNKNRNNVFRNILEWEMRKIFSKKQIFVKLTQKTTRETGNGNWTKLEFKGLFEKQESNNVF